MNEVFAVTLFALDRSMDCMANQGQRLLFLVLACLALSVNAISEEYLNLTEFLKDVALTNPDLVYSQKQAQVSQAEAGTAFYFPPPTVTAGFMGERSPFAARMENSLSFTQSLPFPTKTAAKKNALSAQAQSMAYLALAKKREVLTAAKRAFFDYWRAAQTVELLQEKIKVLMNHAQRVRSAPFSTQLMQAHLLSAQSDIDFAQNDWELAKQELESARATLNVFMGKDPGSALGVPGPFRLSDLPTMPKVPGTDLTSQAAATHPLQLAANEELRAADCQVQASRSEYLPDLMLGYRYNKRYDNVASNHELMVGITLPFLFPWQPKALREFASSKSALAMANQQRSELDLKLQIKKAYLELASLRAQIQLLEAKTLEQASSRGRIAHSIAPTDSESLMEHREAMEKFVEVKMKQVDLKASYAKKLADFESLTASEGTGAFK